jgi:uncharacterized membrane protein YgdD (TMEM256/DUF423 family)
MASIAAALAGLAGCGGVILSAVAAHVAASPLLSTAGGFLVLHAAAVLALVGIALAAPRRGDWCLCAAAALLAGSFLFSADLARRALFDARLFPMAVPIGGSLLIIGWGAAAIAAMAALWPQRS